MRLQDHYMERLGTYKGKGVFQLANFAEYYELSDTERNDADVVYVVDHNCLCGGKLFGHLYGTTIMTCTPIDWRVLYAKEIAEIEPKKVAEPEPNEVKVPRVIITERRTVESLADETNKRLDALVAEGRRKLAEQSDASEKRLRDLEEKKPRYNKDA